MPDSDKLQEWFGAKEWQEKIQKKLEEAREKRLIVVLRSSLTIISKEDDCSLSEVFPSKIRNTGEEREI